MVLTLSIGDQQQRMKDGSSGSSRLLLSLQLSDRLTSAAFLKAGPASYHLLALGMRNKVAIVQLKMDDELQSIEEATVLKEVNHAGDRVQCLCWDPLSKDSVGQGKVRIATGGRTEIRMFSLGIYSALASDGDEAKVFPIAHKDYVNALAFQPWTGELLASGSDDCSIHIYSTETGQRVHSITFGSPVMSLRWHPAETENAKMMAAEKSGKIYMFNMISFTPILSIEVGYPMTGPLLSADWSQSDSSFIMATVGSELFIWDLTRLSMPVLRKSLHDGTGLREAQFSQTSEFLISTIGRPCYSVKVYNAASSHNVFSMDSLASSVVAWHPKTDILALGQDNKLSFYNIGQKGFK